MYKYFFVSLCLTLTSCRSNHTPIVALDPWHARYQHTSGKYYLVLNHFMKESVAVDVIEQGQKKPRNMFFADIKADMATFQDRTDYNCRFSLKSINKGIVLSDQCHGTNEIDGLYKRIGDFKQ